MIIPKFEDFNSSNCKPRSLEIHYPEFYKMIVENYHCDTWNENLYWYYNKLTDYPRCKTCGDKTKFINLKEGYREFCSKKCSNSNKDKQEKTKQVCIEKFGGIAPASSKEVQKKMKETNLERYGVENAMQNKNISSRSQQTNVDRYGGCGNASKELQEKYQLTIQEKYGVDNPMKSNVVKERAKNNFYSKYGVWHQSQLPDIIDKISNTKRKNKTFHTSQIEELFKDYLDSINIEYIRQYKNKKYPFNCDFYIPKFDLYIEIQGNWLHGKHPYDPKIDNKIIEMWKSKNTKFYNNAIEVWTIKDPLKRKITKDNNLRFLEIFSNNIDEVIYEYTRALERFGLDS